MNIYIYTIKKAVSEIKIIQQSKGRHSPSGQRGQATGRAAGGSRGQAGGHGGQTGGHGGRDAHEAEHRGRKEWTVWTQKVDFAHTNKSLSSAIKFSSVLEHVVDRHTLDMVNT